MKDKIYPLLSDGLKDLLKKVLSKHEGCAIIRELLDADNLINKYNTFCGWFRSDEEDTENEILFTTIMDKINTIITDEARMLGFRFNSFEISYLVKGREPKYSSSGVWSRENRQTAKPARIIQKLLKKEFKCKEFEDFSNWIKAEMMNSGEFVILSGTDITWAYNEENYYNGDGTIGNSCMRYEECQDYFRVYEKYAKILVCKKEDKVMGRAIIWEIDGKTYMDRIYTCFDYLDSQFIDYAETNGWYHRVNNSLLGDGEMQQWLGPEDGYHRTVCPVLTIHVGTGYSYMPYVDSFRYYVVSEGILTTDPSSGGCRLSNTDGTFDDDMEAYECDYCHEIFYGYDGEIPDNMVWSERHECYYCEDCAVYVSGIDDYVSPDEEIVTVYFRGENSHTYILDDVLDCPGDFVKIGDTWYTTDNPGLVEKNGEYTLID